MPNSSFTGLIHALEHNQLSILTSGTTSVGNTATTDVNYILAGTSSITGPDLQFIGGLNTHNDYSVESILAGNGSINLGFATSLTVTNGIAELGGNLLINDVYSSTTLDGNSLVDANGSLNDYGGGAVGGGAVTLNGTITVGSIGTNKLNLPSIGGNGTILQTGNSDATDIDGSVGAGVDLNVRAGNLTIGSSFGTFNGTIGPISGNGPALGASASITFYTAAFDASDVQSATFDTSTGMLSFIGANNRKLDASFRFSGDTRGLGVSTASGAIVITDHPGVASALPISFT